MLFPKLYCKSDFKVKHWPVAASAGELSVLGTWMGLDGTGGEEGRQRPAPPSPAWKALGT